jgi:hypothetical protein
MQKTHYYLVDTSVVLPGAAVSALQFNIIEERPFTVQNLKVSSKTFVLLVLQHHLQMDLGLFSKNTCLLIYHMKKYLWFR